MVTNCRIRERIYMFYQFLYFYQLVIYNKKILLTFFIEKKLMVNINNYIYR